MYITMCMGCQCARKTRHTMTTQTTLPLRRILLHHVVPTNLIRMAPQQAWPDERYVMCVSCTKTYVWSLVMFFYALPLVQYHPYAYTHNYCGFWTCLPYIPLQLHIFCLLYAYVIFCLPIFICLCVLLYETTFTMQHFKYNTCNVISHYYVHRKLDEYSKEYQSIKGMRRLVWKTHLGIVDVRKSTCICCVKHTYMYLHL